MLDKDVQSLSDHIENKNLLSEDTRTKFIAIISELPQLSKIKLKDATAWVNSTCAMAVKFTHLPENHILWHASRLRGFGGSEIGALIGERFNVHNAFSSPRDVLLDKLMVNRPEEPSQHTLRGNAFEDILRQSTISRLNDKFDDLNVIDKPDMRHDKDHPWLIGNPDFVYEIKRKMGMADFKIPGTERAAEAGRGDVDFDYLAQQHHYWCCMKGPTEDGESRPMALFVYDFGLMEEPLSKALFQHATADSDKFNDTINHAKAIMQEEEDNGTTIWGNKFRNVPLPYMKEIERAIYEEGDRHFDMLLNGTVPQYKKVEKRTIENESLAAQANDAVSLKVAASTLAKKGKEIEAIIMKQLGTNASDRDSEIGGLTIRKGNPTLKLNAELAIEMANGLKYSPKLYRPVNNKKLLELLRGSMSEGDLVKKGVMSFSDGKVSISSPRSNSIAYEKVATMLEGDISNLVDAVTHHPANAEDTPTM